MKKSENIHERKDVNNVNTDRRNISGGHEISENTNGNDRSHNGFVSNGRTATNNAELNKEEIQREGTVTEQELLKMMIMITCQKKNTQEM